MDWDIGAFLCALGHSHFETGEGLLPQSYYCPKYRHMQLHEDFLSLEIRDIAQTRKYMESIPTYPVYAGSWEIISHSNPKVVCAQ